MRRPIISTTNGMPRRDFIQRMIGGGVASAVTLMSQGKTFASLPNGKTLVVIFQRGANDGVNTIVPYGDNYYKDVHRPEIYIPVPDGGDLSSAVDLNGFFGLHPRLCATSQDSTIIQTTSPSTVYYQVPLNGGFKKLWDNNKLAIFPAVNYNGNSLSHFVQQDRIEAIPSDNKTLSTDGYLNRYLQRYQDAVNLQAANIGSGVIKAMRGSAIVPTFFNLAGYQLYDPSTSPFIDPELQNIIDGNISSSFNQEPPSQKVYGQLVHEFGRKLVGDIALIRQITSDPQIISAGLVDANRTPLPKNDALYPGNLSAFNINPPVTRVTATAAKPTEPSTITTLAAQLRDVAHIIKVGKQFPSYNVSLRLAALDHNGGYDTHNNQGRGDTYGNQGRLHYDMSQSVNAFLTDLGAFQSDPQKNYAKDVIVMVQTEFGRTVAQNASSGTDHGVGACWFVIGGGDNFNGGIYYDTSAGGISQGYSLAPANLDSGRYIRRTVGYKDIIEDIFRGHMGVTNPTDLSAIIPRKPGDATETNFTPTGAFS